MASLSAVSFLRLSSNLLFRRWCSSFGRGDPTKNYYNILDVDPKADDKEIKSAFYAQSKKLHPDVSPEDSKAPDKFKELVEAYEVLSDSKKRQTYDDALGTTKKEPTFHSDDMPSDSSRPRYGVDPRIMRNINIDLSEERMQYAWAAYKERWAREEDHLKNLEEQKMIFRMEIDKKRSRYSNMTDEEKATFRENLRLLKHPRFMKKESEFESDMNGAKERKEGFYSESDSRPSPSKMRFSRMQHAVNFENDTFKNKGEDNHAKSEPFSSAQSSKSKNDNINQKSDKKDIKKEFDQKAYYQEIYDRRDPKMPEFFKREDKNDSSDKNAGAQSGKNRAYQDPDDDLTREWARELHGDGNVQGQDPLFGSGSDPLFGSQKSRKGKQNTEDFFDEMGKNTEQIRKNWKSATHDGTKDMAASRKEAYVIGGFIIFFLFALLTEKIGDFKGSNSNMYVYLEENRKNNESK